MSVFPNKRLVTTYADACFEWLWLGMERAAEAPDPITPSADALAEPVQCSSPDSKGSTIRQRTRQGDAATSSSQSAVPLFPEEDDQAPSVVQGTKLGARKSSSFRVRGETAGEAATEGWEAQLQGNRRVNVALMAVRAEKYGLLENVPQVKLPLVLGTCDFYVPYTCFLP